MAVNSKKGQNYFLAFLAELAGALAAAGAFLAAGAFFAAGFLAGAFLAAVGFGALVEAAAAFLAPADGFGTAFFAGFFLVTLVTFLPSKTFLTVFIVFGRALAAPGVLYDFASTGALINRNEPVAPTPFYSFQISFLISHIIGLSEI